jgi:hypothetical protein
VSKSDNAGKSATKVGKGKIAARKPNRKGRKDAATARTDCKASSKSTKPCARSTATAAPTKITNPAELEPIVVRHQQEVPEGLPRKYFLKSTFNTHDIMHAPVEKTLKMLDKILAGERLFTM